MASACDDPAALQDICDRLQPGTIEVFAQRWLHRLPMPFSDYDEACGYWRELSMRQVETSRNIVFDAPRRARGFFEALSAPRGALSYRPRSGQRQEEVSLDPMAYS